MDVFELRQKLVDDYKEYTRSFIKIADSRINGKVSKALEDGLLWPEPLLQLNPTFQTGGTIDDLVTEGALHPKCKQIFKTAKSAENPEENQLKLYLHQAEAIKKAIEGKSFVLTSGTGSGKSLTYIVPIVDFVLKHGSRNGIKAIIVYPMNALANSQYDSLVDFLRKDFPEGQEPVTFAKFTGQERDEREEIRNNPPDILLTNYMMLELLLTRFEDRQLVRAAQGLNFLVFDELHTYRGRQGADIALLIRRCRMAFGNNNVICIGTSATMASEGNSLDQKEAVADVAGMLFGVPFTKEQIIGEHLERATSEIDVNVPEQRNKLRKAIIDDDPSMMDYESFSSNPVSSWIESTFGIQAEPDTGFFIRQSPKPLRGSGGAASELASCTGLEHDRCYHVLQKFLKRGSELFKEKSISRFPVFAFRLHQFFTRGDTVWSTIEPEADRHLELSKLGTKPGDP